LAAFAGRSRLLEWQKIAASEALPEGQRRRFKVPKGIFEKKAFNVLALHLEAPARGVGMTPILADTTMNCARRRVGNARR
jgi:hypothetical protein